MTAYANEIPATVYAEAHALGIAAGNACSPTPMVVGTPTTPLGNDIDYSKDTYFANHLNENGIKAYSMSRMD